MHNIFQSLSCSRETRQTEGLLRCAQYKSASLHVFLLLGSGWGVTSKKKNFLLKSARINFGRGVPPDFGNSKKTGCFFGRLPQVQRKCGKIHCFRKKGEVFHIKLVLITSSFDHNLQNGLLQFQQIASKKP